MLKAGMVYLQSRAIMVQRQQRTFDAGRPASATIQAIIKPSTLQISEANDAQSHELQH